MDRKVPGDGQSVNIPTLQYFFDEVRSLVGKAGYWIPVDDLRQQGSARSLSSDR